MTGPLLECQQPTASLETNKIASTAMTPVVPGETIDSSYTSATREKRRSSLILMGESRMHVSIHEMPAPSVGIALSSDHLEILHPDLSSEDTSRQRDSWRDWFACAAVAVYGFQERRSFYRFLPNQHDLHKVQSYEIKVEDAVYYSLIEIIGRPGDERLELLNTGALVLLITVDGTRGPQTIQSADRRHGIWMVKEDLGNLEKMKRILEKRIEFFENRNLLARDLRFSARAEWDEISLVLGKHIAMPNLL